MVSSYLENGADDAFEASRAIDELRDQLQFISQLFVRYKFWFWSLMEVFVKLLLTGLIVLIYPETVDQKSFCRFAHSSGSSYTRLLNLSDLSKTVTPWYGQDAYFWLLHQQLQYEWLMLSGFEGSQSDVECPNFASDLSHAFVSPESAWITTITAWSFSKERRQTS